MLNKERKGNVSRREFLATTAAMTIGMATVVPRSVLGGRGHIAPSDKVTMVCIGCGTHALSAITPLLRSPHIEFVGAADPNRESYDYIAWGGPHSLRNRLRQLLDEPNWLEGIQGHPGGRDVMKFLLETYYRKNRQGWRGSIPVFEDYREMLDRMRDVDSVRIITPDHLHGYMAVDCIKRGKHQLMHKPVANKVLEGIKVADMAAASPTATHLLAFNATGNSGVNQAMAWIAAGAIGTLREIHNWTNRPGWPQFPDIPVETPPIPKGFNWDLWLGPAQMRDFSPQYTHATYRGWYEFGGGSIGDMGYYSMMLVWDALELGTAISASSRFARVFRTNEYFVPSQMVNTWSFPNASAIRFEVPYKNGSGSIFFTWHDGGMKPSVPYGYDQDDLPRVGMMFVGDKGTIVADFHGRNPRLFGPDGIAAKYADVPFEPQRSGQTDDGTPLWLHGWLQNIRTGIKNPGAYELTRDLTATFNLGAVSLQRNGRKLLYDPTLRRVTNDEEANALLGRDTRKGWEFV